MASAVSGSVSTPNSVSTPSSAPRAVSADSPSCQQLLQQYHTYSLNGPCPLDRHLVEQLLFDPHCPKPGLRRCRAVMAPTYEPVVRPNDVEARMRTNVVWAQFPHLSSWRDMRVASRYGKLRGKFEPPDGTSWAATVWEARSWQHHYHEYLPAKYEGVWNLPLRSGRIRLALDVGGGSGRFAAALRSLYNITCITTVRMPRAAQEEPERSPHTPLNRPPQTRDNAPGTYGHYFDLPFFEMVVQDGLPAITWSGADRLPVPDLSFDLIHAESAVENFSPALEVWEGILYDWDRMLRPEGYVIIRGRIDERDHRLFSQSLRNFTRHVGWEVVQWPKRFDKPAPNAFGEFVFRKRI